MCEEHGTRARTGSQADRGSTTGAPRWVKVSGSIAVVLVMMVGVMLLIGGGDHGPRRHSGAPSGVTPTGAAGHTPPAGGHGP